MTRAVERVAPSRGTAAQAPSTAAPDTTAVTGVSLMIIGMLIVPMLDVLAKLLATGGAAAEIDLGEKMPVLQITLGRFAIQAALVLPIALFVVGRPALWPAQPGLAALRGALIAGATTLFFAGLEHLQLAEAIAIFFVEPLILTVLSALFLGERIGWRRVAAVLIGLGGALLIIRPNFVEVGWPALFPLGAAVCFAFYLLLTKMLTAREHALTLHLWAGVAGAAFVGAALLVGGALAIPQATAIAPNTVQWALLGLLGLIAAVGHFFVVMAFRRAPASVLAPFQYVEIVAATLFGLFIFSEWPDAITWIGVAIIVGSGAFVFWRERVAARGA